MKLNNQKGLSAKVNGRHIVWKDGIAEFLFFGILVRVDKAHFTLEWCIKMDSRLHEAFKNGHVDKMTF